MNNKLVIFASLTEALPTIHKYNGIKDTIFPQLYFCSNYDIVISGLGILNAAYTTMLFGHRYSTIFNIGFSGIINPKLTLGSFYDIGVVDKLTFTNAIFEKEDRESPKISYCCFPEIILSDNPVSLISSDFPVRTVSAQSLCKYADLVDMEAYGIAFIAKKLGVSCKIIKIATDIPSLKGRKFLKENTSLFSLSISDYMSEII